MAKNIRTLFVPRAASLLLIPVIHFQLSAFAQGTAFTYQGRLNDGANAAQGIYDLRFAIYDSTNLPGTILSGPITNSATSVSNGLFTVTLDFGNVFTGGSNYLDIAVRTNGGSSFTPLSPRQAITPAPYAVFANTASNLNGTLPASQLSGTVPLALLPSTVAQVNSNLTFSGVNTFSNSVGVGSPPGGFTFFVHDTRPSSFPSVGIEADSTLGAWLTLQNASAGGRVWGLISSGSGNSEGAGKLLFRDQSVALTRMVISTNGNVGINTANPSNALSVLGSADFSSVGVGASPGTFPLYVRDTTAVSGPSVVVEANSISGTWLQLLNDSAGGRNWSFVSSGSGNTEGAGRLLFRDQFLGLTRMVISTDGSVGIGTNPPQAKLHVAGDIMANGKVLMGSGGTNYAANSTESLRIVRGSINGDGTTARGSGFTAVHNGPVGTGSYTITFTPAFSGTPSVTVTAVNVAARAGGSISASSITVSTINFNTSLSVDDSFSFIAIGPY